MRKKFGLLMLLLALSLCIAGCGGNASGSSGQQLVIVDWGGALTDARVETLFEPFEEAHGVEIVVESPTDYGKFKAMVESGNVIWDVVNVENSFALRATEQDLLEPLDFNVIDKEGFTEDMVTDYSIGAEYYATTIAFRNDVENTPATWADFWNTEKYPGSRSLYKNVMPTLEMALLADGVAPEDLYPLDVERAFASLDKLKGELKVWWTTGSQPPQILSDSSVNYASAWNGRISAAANGGSPVTQDFTEALLIGESWVVPKGNKNKELAMEFLAFASTPEVQAEFAKVIDYIPANAKSLDLLTEEDLERLGVVGETIKLDEMYWLENFEELDKRFQEWLLK